MKRRYGGLGETPKDKWGGDVKNQSQRGSRMVGGTLEKVRKTQYLKWTNREGGPNTKKGKSEQAHS